MKEIAKKSTISINDIRPLLWLDCKNRSNCNDEHYYCTSTCHYRYPRWYHKSLCQRSDASEEQENNVGAQSCCDGHADEQPFVELPRRQEHDARMRTNTIWRSSMPNGCKIHGDVPPRRKGHGIGWICNTARCHHSFPVGQSRLCCRVPICNYTCIIIFLPMSTRKSRKLVFQTKR